MAFINIRKIDNETMRALVCAAGAVGLGWNTGVSAKQVAALAAIGSAGGAIAYHNYGDANRTLFSTRFPAGSLLTGILAISGHFAGSPDAGRVWGIASLGLLGSSFLWDHSPSEDMEYDLNHNVARHLPAFAYPLIGMMIGALRPQWITPTQGAVLMGLIQAGSLTRAHVDKVQPNNWTNVLYNMSVFAAPWAAGKLGVPAGLKELAVVAIATQTIAAGFVSYETGSL